MERVVIIGGGVSGLSCLNALLDKGVSALLIEGGVIGSPKMCGEFLASCALPYLEKWNISSIQPIKDVIFSVKNREFKLNFPVPAGALTRRDLELQLAKRAREKSGRILECSPIQKIIPAEKKSPFRFYLHSGEIIEAQSAIFATGKLNSYHNLSSAPSSYLGFKVHFKQIVKPETLQMYSLHGAYFGIVPVSNETSNFACLARREVIEKIGTCKQFFYDLVDKNKALSNVFKSIDINNITWLEGQVPSFHRKKIPAWQNAFWIGDALASVHPAVGYGFAHSVKSAVMAAECYVQNNPTQYLKIAVQDIRSKLWISRFLHRLLLNPSFGYVALSLMQTHSWFPEFFMKRLDYDLKS